MGCVVAMVAMKRFLHEPLVHFLLAGALLFGVFRLLGPASADPASTRIVLTMDQVAQMLRLFQSQWGRPPTQAEFNAMIEAGVKEEVLYREALAMGLDKEDEIVRRRMAQKVEFLSEDVANAHEPSGAELQAWYATHSARFDEPRRVSFRHLYFSPDRRGPRAQADAAGALARLAGRPEDAPLAATLADPFMFQDYYRDQTRESLRREFGPGFAAALDTLPEGRWSGPVESGLGWHLVFVDAVIPGQPSPLEAVLPQVRDAWLDEQKAVAWDSAYAAMRKKYTVFLPGVPDSASAPGGTP